MRSDHILVFSDSYVLSVLLLLQPESLLSFALFSSMISRSWWQSSEVLSTQLVALETEKADLVQTLSKVEAELTVQGEELQRVQSSLATERESGVKTAEALQNQLNEKVRNGSNELATDVLLDVQNVSVHRRAGSRRWRVSWRRLAGPVCREP